MQRRVEALQSNYAVFGDIVTENYILCLYYMIHDDRLSVCQI